MPPPSTNNPANMLAPHVDEAAESAPPSPSRSPPPKKKREGEGQPKEDHNNSYGEDEESVGDCLSDEEEYYESDEDSAEDDDNEDIVETPHSHKVLEGVKKMVDYLAEHNQFLLPSKELPQFVDINLIPSVGDSKKHPLIYSVVEEEDGDLKIIKLAGATMNGSKREGYLKKSHPGALYIQLFKFGSHLDSTTHQFLMDSIKELCKDICTIDKEVLESMTVQQALDTQSDEGIPFTLNLLMHYVNDRGAFKLRGLLKRLAIHLLESGFQEYAKMIERGKLYLVDGALDCVQHEFLQGSALLEGAADKMKIVARELNRLLETLRKEFGSNYIEYLRIESVIMEFLAAWAPDVDCLIFTAVIYGGMGPWGAAYGDRNPCKKGEGDVYDDSGFGVDDHEYAKGNIDKFVNHTMKVGGKVGGLNENKCAFRYMGTTAEEYLVANGWNHVCDLEGFVFKVYSYMGEDWKFPAIIILHGPPCPIMNSKPSVPVNNEWVNKSRKSSRGTAALDEFAKMLRTPQAIESFSEEMNDYFVLGNILVMQCMIEYLVVDVHLYRFATSVIAKQFRVNFNVLCDEHTGLMLKGTPRLTKKEPNSKIDFHVPTKLRNALSQTKKSELERINNCAEILRKQLHDDETEEEKERNVGDQNRTLRRAIREIGLHDRIKTRILDEWQLKSDKKIKKITADIQTEEKQRKNDFDALLADRSREYTSR